MDVHSTVSNGPVHHLGPSPLSLGLRPQFHHSEMDPAIVVCGPTVVDSTSSVLHSSKLDSHTQGLRPLLVFSARVPAEAVTSSMDATPHLPAHEVQLPIKSSGGVGEMVLQEVIHMTLVDGQLSRGDNATHDHGADGRDGL